MNLAAYRSRRHAEETDRVAGWLLHQQLLAEAWAEILGEVVAVTAE